MLEFDNVRGLVGLVDPLPPINNALEDKSLEFCDVIRKLDWKNQKKIRNLVASERKFTKLAISQWNTPDYLALLISII